VIVRLAKARRNKVLREPPDARFFSDRRPSRKCPIQRLTSEAQALSGSDAHRDLALVGNAAEFQGYASMARPPDEEARCRSRPRGDRPSFRRPFSILVLVASLVPGAAVALSPSAPTGPCRAPLDSFRARATLPQNGR
jgi:hypothetical protein